MGKKRSNSADTSREHMVKAFLCVYDCDHVNQKKLLKLLTCSHMITQLCVYTCSTLFSFNTACQTLSKSSPFKKYNNQIIHRKVLIINSVMTICDSMDCRGSSVIGFSRKEYQRVPFPSTTSLSDLEIEPGISKKGSKILQIVIAAMK